MWCLFSSPPAMGHFLEPRKSHTLEKPLPDWLCGPLAGFYRRSTPEFDRSPNWQKSRF
jgi:hypothetical protein